MFQVELLSGGITTVYAVDADAAMFLTYCDGGWDWLDMTECKPYIPPYMGLLTREA